MWPPPAKKRKLLLDDEKGWLDINVSVAQWESAIDSTLEANNMLFLPEPVDNDWSRSLDHDDPIRVHVCNLTGILDPDILPTALEEALRDSKFAMAPGSTVTENPQDPEGTDIFVDTQASVTEAMKTSGVSKRHLAEV